MWIARGRPQPLSLFFTGITATIQYLPTSLVMLAEHRFHTPNEKSSPAGHRTSAAHNTSSKNEALIRVYMAQG